ncbi:hypothetical protein [Maribellus sediminis]|uniref:hypothetical protein n=1 Tax=Maribellus sediminis TaxID=2696285 RepID=UPI00143031F2|nr:hypothetical protein [Maribellus sediminis]
MIRGSFFSSNSNPFITVNKLAEYMNANPTRRRQIANSFKEDKDFKKNYYQLVKTAIPKFFKSGYDVAVLNRAIRNAERMLEDASLTDWAKGDYRNSILALESLKTANLPDLSNYEVVDLGKLDEIELAGVAVSIKPDVYLKHTKTGKYGVVKVNITKTEGNRLISNSMEYAATMLQVGLMSLGYEQSEIDHKGCFSVDIFDGNFEHSPRAYKRTVASLENACKEYSLLWDSL